ncbi:MAG TPA: polysaccharide lyase family 7 protein [Acidobacteriaceae bacterium]
MPESPFKSTLASTLALLMLLALVSCSAGSSNAQTATSQPGTISLLSSSITATQASGSISITVNRTNGFNGAVTVAYATSNGTATAGTDYTATSSSLTWPDGDTTPRLVAIPINASPAFYGLRTFAFTLSAPTGGAILGTASVAVSITGNSTSPAMPGTLGFSSNSATIAQTVGSIIVPVSRSSGSSGAVAVSYATGNGSATAGNEYAATSGSLSWADGDTAVKNITVPLSNASPYNGSHTFMITLASPTNGAALSAIPSVTINVTGSWIAPSTYSQFDLSKWKLTLPIDQYGGTGGTNGTQYEAYTIYPAQLTAGFTDAYFYADTSGNVIFTAPSNGASTSPGSGSDHTRSELRELYTGTGADSNNDWSSTIGGTLTATCRVLSVSVNSDEATIGQIHGQNYVFMLIIYRPGNKDIAVDIYTSNTSTSAHSRTSLLTGVNLGDTVTYSIRYAGSTITTTVKDVTTNSATQTLLSSPDSTWTGTGVYFKLGAYHAVPNKGNPAGDQTQVSFSAFATTH